MQQFMESRSNEMGFRRPGMARSRQAAARAFVRATER
jgi:hypothetical protein